jgi:hypothetical protein
MDPTMAPIMLPLVSIYYNILNKKQPFGALFGQITGGRRPKNGEKSPAGTLP